MGLLNKTVFTVDVDFFGVRAWQTSNDPPDLRTRVRAEEPPMVAAGRSAFALLVPLVAARLLYLSKAERRLTTPMMDALHTASVLLVDPDEDPAEFSFRRGDFREVATAAVVASGGDEEAALAAVEDGELFGQMLFAAVPALEPSTVESPDMTFQASLMQGRRAWWAKVNTPRTGPAFFSLFGLFALIEHVARTADRRSTLQPATHALGALCHLYFDVLRGHGFDSMRMLTSLNETAADVVLADDPEAALEEIKDMYEPMDIEPTPDVAAREAREVAMRHQMNADLADSAVDDEAAERIRQEAKRLRAGREVPDLTESVLAWRDALPVDPLGDDPRESDLEAAIDAASYGYAVRLAEERLNPPQVPDGLGRRIKAEPSVLTAAIELVRFSKGDADGGIIGALFGGAPEAWEGLRYWGWQAAAHNSRERWRAMGGEPFMCSYLAAPVDYDRAFVYGYAVRAVEHIRGAAPSGPSG